MTKTIKSRCHWFICLLRAPVTIQWVRNALAQCTKWATVLGVSPQRWVALEKDAGGGMWHGEGSVLHWVLRHNSFPLIVSVAFAFKITQNPKATPLLSSCPLSRALTHAPLSLKCKNVEKNRVCRTMQVNWLQLALGPQCECVIKLSYCKRSKLTSLRIKNVRLIEQLAELGPVSSYPCSSYVMFGFLSFSNFSCCFPSECPVSTAWTWDDIIKSLH